MMHPSFSNYRAIWMKGSNVLMIEQNLLPFEFKIYESKNYKDTCEAIKNMTVRGAGALGNAAAYAMAQAAIEAKNFDYFEYIQKAKQEIESTRPTAQNLFAATNRVYQAALISAEAAYIEAENVAQDDISDSRAIGEYGNQLIKSGYQIETHCNAGWLAFMDRGTALSPIFQAHRESKQILVYVDETRPRSQGARLTAWELNQEGIPNIIIPDNAGAYIMSKGKVDMMITGADRIAQNGDTANKIGTYEKAIVAKHFGIPFYIAAPTSTIDIRCTTGNQIPIEERSTDEIFYQTGINIKGKKEKVLVCAPNSKGLNPAFDVTPANLISGIITEKGIIVPSEKEIMKLFK